MSWELSYALTRFLYRLEQFGVGLRRTIDKFGFTKTIAIAALAFAGAFALAPKSTFVVAFCLGSVSSPARYAKRREPFKSGLEPITFAVLGGIAAAFLAVLGLQEVRP